MTAPTPAVPAPAAPVPALGRLRWRWAAHDAWAVVGRCEAILAGLAAVVAVGVSAAQQSDVGDAISIMAWVWGIHAVLTLVVGYPLGVVVTRLLPPRPARGTAALGYAAAGASAAALLILLWGVAPPAAVAGWAALGAATAGSARAWAHRSLRDRALHRETLAPAWSAGLPPVDGADAPGHP